MDTIFQCSSRTRMKIIRRLDLKCFNCQWDEDVCDLHHIIPKAKGGSDDGNNLTYVCPNCHRLAHSGKLMVFKTFDEVVGDQWKQFYKIVQKRKNPRKPVEDHGLSRMEILIKARKTRAKNVEVRAKKSIAAFKDANIDVTTYGWVHKAGAAMGLAPQKVVKYIQSWEPALLNGARLRSNAKLIKV